MSELDFINTAVTKFGYKSMKERYYWTILNKKQAVQILTHVLYEDMAYNSRIMEEEKAAELANKFLDLFIEEDTLFVTNGMFYKTTDSGSWSDISNATFDSGVIAFDNNRLGIVWFENED